MAHERQAGSRNRSAGWHSMRVFLVGNGSKPDAQPVFKSLQASLPAVCDVVGDSLDPDYAEAASSGPDLIAVVGGDGTLIAVARGTVGSEIPLAGVNAGKLGFLAEFTEQEIIDTIRAGVLLSPRSLSERMMLDVKLLRGGELEFRSPAANDCVVRDPRAMLRLSVCLDGEHLTNMGSDGVIVCTPSGSTAYNLAAGGPLLQPGVDAMVLTPICPHGLTFRSLAVEASRTVTICPESACDLIIDGQPPVRALGGDTVKVSRHHSTFLLVHNTSHAPWHAMRTKLHWGQ